MPVTGVRSHTRNTAFLSSSGSTGDRAPVHDTDPGDSMCGFAGELRLDGRAPDPATVDAMADRVRPRGPDAEGLVSLDRAALGHRRLKIIDLSDAAGQPMTDDELGLTIAYNGETYNFVELRRELEGAGYRFTTSSDTEVVLKAYHHWGDSFVERCNGMFAFCIVEHASGRALLGRDRLGIKPLYLAEVDGGLRFASSLPALLAGGGVSGDIDPVALHHYLSWHAVVPAPHTILADVRKLAPATTMAVEPDGRRDVRRYWQPSFTRHDEHDDWDAEDWAAAIEEELRAAVRRRLVADVPVGVLLSGGLDSSLIVGMLAEEGQTGLATFSVGFDTVGDRAGDEFEFSDLVAREFATEHQRIRVGADRLLDALPGAIGAMSEPMVSHDVVGFYLLSEEVSRSIKVVQTGQGADELFAGYHWYPPMTADGADVETYIGRFFDRPHTTMVDEVVGDAHRLDRAASREFVEEHFASDGAQTPADRALRLDTQVMLVDDPVKRVDNMTMAWGLEARVPFLDHRLVDLAAACPPALKVADRGKGVLKAAARGVVPDAVIDREKGSFPVPAVSEMSGEVLGLVRDALTAPEARRRGLFRPAYVERLLDDPQGSMTPLDGNELWQIGLLELWLQQQGVPA